MNKLRLKETEAAGRGQRAEIIEGVELVIEASSLGAAPSLSARAGPGTQ